MGDIVAHVSVSARRRLAQFAVLVNERNCDTIHLWLDYDRNFFVRQKALDAGIKIFHFLFRVCVVQAEHRNQMGDLFKCFQRFSADALCGRIRRDKIGKLRFEIDEFLVEPVVFAISNYGRSFFVVEVIVFPDFVPELLDPLCGFFLVHGHSQSYRQTKFSAKVERVVLNALGLNAAFAAG